MQSIPMAMDRRQRTVLRRQRGRRHAGELEAGSAGARRAAQLGTAYLTLRETTAVATVLAVVSSGFQRFVVSRT